MIDASAIAARLRNAYQTRQLTPPPSLADTGFDLDAAYRVQDELVRMRRASGHRTVGRKVGFANKALWRVMKLATLVWGPMFDDTVQYAVDGVARLDVRRLVSPKIEPEIVFKLKAPVARASDAAAVLESAEWLALGFEIIDCVFPDWKYQPADFVAAYGLHAGLVVGKPRPVGAADIPALVDALPAFGVTLSKNGEAVAQGSGKNSLRSPALCVAELASAITGQPGAEPLAAGELVSSGTLTDSMPLGAGESWTAQVSGIDLASLTLHT